jgi:hypothetical protein
MSSHILVCRCYLSLPAKAAPVRSAGVPSSAVPELISLEALAGLEPHGRGASRGVSFLQEIIIFQMCRLSTGAGLLTTLACNFNKYRGPFIPYINNTLRRWSHCSKALPRVCSRSNKSPESIVCHLHIKRYTQSH